ncbi:probable leucine-rich repeat receptor-like protein kinase At2g33170 [Lycium ferocissimum]|uniref:probable leucine-rich repeat receptor-like protein kinase At2g33170 n=1 Tax=Lycium ferocissimum TaxID=112874 RepID=UPI0028154C56|nr:probable leucine-rich repeat receptor-like protein kinase At2g33170 [Lycium ferocissimum]
MMSGILESRSGLVLLWISALVAAVLLVSPIEGLNQEGIYLLELKKNIWDQFNHLWNWNPKDETPCGWVGVNCTSDYNPVVQSLYLSSMNLSGTLSPSIGGLENLVNLDLSFNRFTGNIPKEIGNCSKLLYLHLHDNSFYGIPNELYNLSNLDDVNLCNNMISGPIAEEFGKLSSLVSFVAYTNNLTGPVPRSIGSLKNLSIFRVGQNTLSGSLPTEIGDCWSLESLGLAQNSLGGNIPKELGKLGKLKELVLWDNQFSGYIPKELGNCTELELLALYQNSLVGEIPVEIGKLKVLTKLYLYRNGLNGTIPREIGNLSMATEIDFSENFLTGEIPVEFGQIKWLNLLYLFQNQLKGVIPDELTTLKYLRRLDLSINYLTGPIPFGFQYQTELVQLQLFENSLTGTIPQGLGVYSGLWVLDLNNNHLTGRIPPFVCRNSNLILLNLASNKLHGYIPSGVLNCNSLVQLRLNGNKLTGKFPSELCKLVNLSAVELAQNKFTGPIPPEIGYCQKLQRLDFSGNSFNQLPREIGNLTRLVTFNVSANLFTGPIPPGVLNCKALQRLDLSKNRFTDVIPDDIGSLSQLERLLLSENKLSGKIPATLGSLSHLTELQMGGNLLSGEIPSELGNLTGLQIAMDLSNNNLSGNIPPNLGNLILLEYLYVNNNHLSGEIPSTFGNLTSLLGIDFSYNDLTGPLPDIPLFRNMNISSFIGNKGLCGGPLGGCNAPPAYDPNNPPGVKNADSPRGKIVTVVAGVIGGVSLVLIAVILFYMKRHPVERVATEDKDVSSSDPDIYFRPKEGFSFQDLVEATNNFHDSYVLGRGAVGTVYKAVMQSGQTIAVKKLASNREGNNIDNSFRAEILTLGKIRHRNIVKLYGFCYHQGSNLLLYEYMARGSLGELLHGESCKLDWPTRFVVAVGAAQGLTYLHHDCKPRIIHRDIKSNNILLDEKFEAHVGDFGLAKVVDMPQSKSMSAVAGSYGYIAPEYAYTMKVTEKCDIYSYGVVLLELLTGRAPVQPLEQGGDLVTWVKHYVRDHSLTSGILDSRLDLEDEATVSHMLTVLKVALMCTSMSPHDRPSMREVVLMLIESDEQEGNFLSSPVYELPLKDNSF